MSREKHVVICGAGVIGLCSAYYLIQRGHRVTILDRGAADHDCCSLGNAGLIPPSHFVPLSAPGMVARGLKWMLNPTSPFYVRPRLDVALARWAWRFMRAANVAHVARSAPLLRDLHLASRKLFEELAARAGNDFGLVQRGLLMLCKTEQAIEEEAKFAAHAQALGVPVEIVSAKRAAELDPGVKMDIAGAIYFPLDCHLTPSRFLASLTRTLEQCGAKFLWSHNVTGWRDARARVHAALTDKGEIAADEFVLAGGAWSAGVVRGLALSLPLQPAKGYSLTLPQPPRLPQLSSILVERWVAITPMGNALRVGGTLELSGFNQEIRRERVRQIQNIALNKMRKMIEKLEAVQK